MHTCFIYSEPEVPAESTSTSHQQETKVAVKPTPPPLPKPPDVPDKKSDPASTKVMDDFKKRNMEDLDKLKKQADDLMKMIAESMTTLENSVKKDAVYQGYLNKEFSSPARIIRIFTSSTFTGKQMTFFDIFLLFSLLGNFIYKPVLSFPIIISHLLHSESLNFFLANSCSVYYTIDIHVYHKKSNP